MTQLPETKLREDALDLELLSPDTGGLVPMDFRSDNLSGSSSDEREALSLAEPGGSIRTP